MAYTPTRRRRRRRTALVVVVAVAALLAIVYAVTRAQSDRQLRREYLDFAIGIAGAQEDAAVRFADMIVRLDELARPTVVATLGEVEEIVTEQSQAVRDAAHPPAGLEQAHVALGIATRKWSDGVEGARQGIETLSETPLDPDGLALLEQGLIDLRVGDAAYLEFRDDVSGVDVGEVDREFPSVSFVPEESELLFDATDIGRRIFLSPDLGVTRDLAVADISLDPGPMGSEGGVPVVPLSETLDAEVTISNKGTVEETGVPVQLDLISQGSRVTFTEDVTRVDPGALASIRFADLPVEPGLLYEIVASVPAEDDDDTNDSATFVFIRNDES
jgi:hypothetical protein